jgi:hypothetical protein
MARRLSERDIINIGGIPIPPALLRHRTAVPGAGEWIDKVIWGVQQYPAAGTTFLDYFLTTSPVLFTSNMEAAGQLPGDKEFLIRAIGVQVIHTAAVAQTDIADFFSIIQRGVARLFIGNKDYSEWPIYLLPASGGGYGDAFTNTAATLHLSITNGVPDVRNSYTLARPLLIPRQLNFRVRLEWPAATATTSAFDVRVMLKGEISRQIQ